MKRYIIAAFATLLLLNSCSKKLDLAPVSSVSDANYWQTPDQVDAFVTGIHSRFRSDNGNFLFLGEMRSDIFGLEPGASGSFTTEATQGLEVMWLQKLDVGSPGVSNFGGFYFNINQLNLLISKLSNTNLVSQDVKAYYLGQAYGMRAFYYFQLLRSWGKVVIQTEPVSSIDISNLAKPASSEADVMKLIKSDIDNSNTSFSNNYSFTPASMPAASNRKALWSKSATQMLKAEVYLWTSYRGSGSADATIAKTALTDIQTNVPSLSLLPNFSDVFATKGNNEIIFASRYQQNEATMAFVPTSFVPQTGLIANFYDSAQNRKMNDPLKDNWGGLLRAPVKSATFRQYDDRDSRKWATIQPGYTLSGGVYKIAGTFVRKYFGENVSGSRQYTNDYPIYRYADLLLLLAEAKVILGENPSTEINLVRARGFGANFNSATLGFPNQPIDVDPKEAILQERLYEFIFEGKRWYDLRRMGDAYLFKHIPVSLFTNTDPAGRLLWPIDRNSLTNNRSLEQNPGYSKF
jgi:starch-binding outer membrane protein, SusD/RagB family